MNAKVFDGALVVSWMAAIVSYQLYAVHTVVLALMYAALGVLVTVFMSHFTRNWFRLITDATLSGLVLGVLMLIVRREAGTWLLSWNPLIVTTLSTALASGATLLYLKFLKHTHFY